MSVESTAIDNGHNVHDHLKGLSVEDIRSWYIANSVNASVAMLHSTHDFNLSNCIRSANFFGFREFFYIGGRRTWDRRGAVGVQHYIPITFCETVDDFFRLVDGRYSVVALENNTKIPGKNVNNMFLFDWPKNPVILCGEEQCGISVDILSRVDHIVEVPAGGTVRSMNVGTAAGIAMASYIGKIKI